MPIDEVTIVQSCGECGAEIETFTVKKDNMKLFCEEEVWCPKCQANKPQVRDLAGRLKSIRKEIESYPKSKPASPP